MPANSTNTSAASTMASGEAAVLFEALPEQATPERVGGGLPRLRYAERSQIEWRPVSLDELVRAGCCAPAIGSLRGNLANACAELYHLESASRGDDTVRRVHLSGNQIQSLLLWRWETCELGWPRFQQGGDAVKERRS
jgi:hypothetical protein